jgi:glycosyltransferase involved in cell wall biosynthesis
MSTRRVVLIHQDEIQHYRVLVYNYLAAFLLRRGYDLTVVAAGIQASNVHPVAFKCVTVPLSFESLRHLCHDVDPHVVILFVNLKHSFLFPLLLYFKSRNVRTVYWGHGIDLEDKNSIPKRLLYSIEHRIVDAILLYGPNERRFVAQHLQHKVFEANNTLNMQGVDASRSNLEGARARFGISTEKNIICVGRLQGRKRVTDLIAAFLPIHADSVGLILVGPDNDQQASLLPPSHPRIFRFGEVYGSDLHDLLRLACVYCLPGHVGLGIVDAFYFGLPLVTEQVDHAPEIMYLRSGVNGFVVPQGDIEALGQKLRLLLFDDALRERFSRAARAEILENGSIEKMAGGFDQALSYSLLDRRRRRAVACDRPAELGLWRQLHSRFRLSSKVRSCR